MILVSTCCSQRSYLALFSLLLLEQMTQVRDVKLKVQILKINFLSSQQLGHSSGCGNCQPRRGFLPRQHHGDAGLRLPLGRGRLQHCRGQVRGEDGAVQERQRDGVRPLHGWGGEPDEGEGADAGPRHQHGRQSDLAADRHLPGLAGLGDPHHHLRPHGLHSHGEGRTGGNCVRAGGLSNH